MLSRMGTQAAPLLSQAAQEVARLESEWVAAALGSDTAALERLLADNFVLTSTTGEINKAQCIEGLKNGDLTFEYIRRDDTTVRDYGDEAVVSGVATVKGQYRGSDISGQYRYRYSEAYAKWAGRWLILIGQVNHIVRN
ncbi:MAG TPA: nuclear transport factor 2 family protein [Pyrinomonadaceae bacterium]|nr:nuclear transport factor 2 family protein [Pyrinomonadaceae bacterium]